jgi:hypothetical protein
MSAINTETGERLSLDACDMCGKRTSDLSLSENDTFKCAECRFPRTISIHRPSRTKVKMTDVYDLNTPDSRPVYRISTNHGVVAVLIAYAVSQNDPKFTDVSHCFNTYRDLLVRGFHTVACGDFVASK